MRHRASKPRRAGGIVNFAPLLLAAALAGCGSGEDQEVDRSLSIGLLTTLPIYWPESESMRDMLSPDQQTPWPRAAIEQSHRLTPLDSLADEARLAQVDAIILAQPRPLAPAENVALDNWVRAGGQALIFADPMLTGHSRFSIGDRRRPQDVVLLSPILARWGLTLSLDERGVEGERLVNDRIAGAIAVNLPGQLQLQPETAVPGDQCEIEPGAVIARCRIGRGQVTVLADAALLEDAPDTPLGPREQALRRLVDSLAAPLAGANSGPAGANTG